MKKLLFLFAILFSLLITVSCENTESDDTLDDPSTDETITPEDDSNTNVFESISEITVNGNQHNWGASAGDATSIYGCLYDEDGAKLYSKNRESGEMEILDEATRISADDTTDLSFFNLHIEEDYLYYLPYDPSNSDRSGCMHRVNLEDGTIEQLTERVIYELCIYDNKIYYTSYTSGGGLYSIDFDGSGEEIIYGSCLQQFWIYEGKIYYQDYLNDGYFRVQLKSISLDDTSTSEVVFDSMMNFTFTFTDLGELYCIDYSSSLVQLVKVDLETLEVERLIDGVGFGKMNTLDGDLYLNFDTATETYETGIYLYNTESNSLEQVVNSTSISICFIGNDEIVYTNTSDQEYAGRFWQLYITDVAGSKNESLFKE